MKGYPIFSISSKANGFGRLSTTNLALRKRRRSGFGLSSFDTGPEGGLLSLYFLFPAFVTVKDVNIGSGNKGGDTTIGNGNKRREKEIKRQQRAKDVKRHQRAKDVKRHLRAKDQCKKGRWSKFSHPPFKNQGQCVSFFNQMIGNKNNDDADDEEGHEEFQPGSHSFSSSFSP